MKGPQPLSASERQRRYRDSLTERGGSVVKVALSAEATDALERLTRDGTTKRAAIEAALIRAAGK